MIKRSVVLLLLLQACFSLSAKEKGDTARYDKGKLFAGIQIGTYSAASLEAFNPPRGSEFVPVPAPVITGFASYFVGRNIALSLSFTANSDDMVYNSKLFLGTDYANTTSHYEGYQYKYNYKSTATALEFTWVYSRLENKANMVLYTGAGAALVHTKGTEEWERDDVYQSGNSTAAIPIHTGRNNINGNTIRLHFVAVGIRGGNKLCWYAEGGYGYRSAFSAGISYRIL